ncbi:MAG: sigma-70 family RNA polymerase sigma factor [Microscillaceae bacterium]|nr:sigma-70 family RNA polymerase sigma factor [Microscillaceae bacterium]MDW8459805.1 sigma-70 family RNA polymerase sigma factor [Cytophagales bacterium]
MKDSELLKRIQLGDETALDYIYKKNYRMMVRLITKNSGNEEEAKDIFQEALIIFWQKATKPDFVLTAKISTFIYSICQNLWRKELERKARLTDEIPEGLDYNTLEQKERMAIINKCINNLGETCRKVLSYYYFDGLSMQEIAERLGFANADTAKTKKYKCKKELDELVKSKYKATDFLD